MPRSLAMTLLALLLSCCERQPPRATVSRATDVLPRPASHSTAATELARSYAESRMSGWKLQASAAGSDCSVLFIEAKIILEDAMVEALHYGAGPYDIIDGGVRSFYRQKRFRGVVYKDSTQRTWSYGAVTRGEALAMTPCH